jgi:YfiH family protein
VTRTAPTLLRAGAGAAAIWCSGRHGGVSTGPYSSCNVGDHVGDDADAVRENRRRVANAAGLPDADTWAWLDQVHGNDVHVATAAAAPGPKPVADAAVTTVPGVPLAIVTADCAPVVVACGGAIGVAHAGHRGLLASVIERTVDEVRARGSGPVRAYLGPCIRPAHYEFGARDLAILTDHFGTEVEGRTHDGRPAFDIPAAVRVALRRAGVDEGAIDDSGVCTAASPDHFSYRRDGKTGRQVTVAVLA